MDLPDTSGMQWTGPLRAQVCALVQALCAEISTAGVEVMAKGQDGLDLVTALDFSIQSRLSEALPALLPGSLVVGEEHYAAAPADTRHVWLVDPLDGTVNFVAGLPAYATAIVLLEEGAPVLAVVHDIPHARTYSASSGDRAFVNDAPLVRTTSPARLAILSSGLLADLAAHAPGALSDLLRAFKLRNFGSQALHLCYAAEGRVSLVASREAKGWDDLAGAFIARQVGLRYGSYRPGASRPLDTDQYSLCAPSELFDLHSPTFAASVPRALSGQAASSGRSGCAPT